MAKEIFEDPKLNEDSYKILDFIKEQSKNDPDRKIGVKDFADLLNCSIPTANRRIRELNNLDLIEYKNRTYTIKPEVDQIYSPQTVKNLALVASVKGLLQQYKNTPVYESVEKLVTFLEPKSVKEDQILPRIAIPPQMEYDVNKSNWDKIYKAIQGNNKIRFQYTSRNSKADHYRTVHPYQILLSDGSCYLFGFNEEHNMELLYVINRMTCIQITSETFTLPEDYDFSSRCGGGRLGAYSGSKIEDYKIEFTGYAKMWIKEHKWADNQKFQDIDEDTTVITFSSSQTDRVLELILSWGSQARPLAPESLVSKWKSEISSMYKLSQE